MENNCPECYPGEHTLWRDLDMNPFLHEYVSTYISPVKQYYPSMDAAMAVWGTVIKPEDIWCDICDMQGTHKMSCPKRDYT